MTEKAPYLITTILGVLAWLVTHIASGVVDSPTLEYDFAVRVEKSEQVVSVQLTNVTRTRLFSDVHAMITIPGSRIEKRPAVDPEQPAYEGAGAPKWAGSSAELIVERMLPGNTYGFTARFAGGTGRPRVRVWSEGVSPVRVVSKGIETYCARHELAILTFVFFGWILALLAVVWLGRASSADRTGIEHLFAIERKQPGRESGYDFQG